MIGAFIRIVRCDGSEDYQWLLEGDITRLAKYSAKNNSYYKNGQRVEGKANELYSSQEGGIDPGFLENKMIKHAFDAYPKVRIGQFTQIQSEQEEESIIDYGFVAEEVTNAPLEETKNQSFDEQEQLEAPKPVTVETTQADSEEGF